jgi:ribosomal protein L21
LGKKFGAIMYAIFESGGKQHRVVEGETLKLEKIEVATGGTVEFDKVYLVAIGDDVKIGAPIVAGAKVIAEVIAQGENHCHQGLMRSLQNGSQERRR